MLNTKRKVNDEEMLELSYRLSLDSKYLVNVSRSGYMNDYGLPAIYTKNPIIRVPTLSTIDRINVKNSYVTSNMIGIS